MARLWTTVSLLIIGVAALKTLLVIKYVLPVDSTGFATVTALFAAFTGLTAGVAYVCFRQLRGLVDLQRKERLAPGKSEPVAKETVIGRYAPVWRLSQAEADVAIFVVKGFSNNEIAEMRGCALATVKSQLSSLYSKSGMESRYQLIAFVTDEVCAMAKQAEEDAEEQAKARSVRSILPLVGRMKRAA